MKPLTLLRYALLGALYGKPASGYDLRKMFTDSPIGRFSDSPGAIYPALRGLEERELVFSRSNGRSALRRRRELELTTAGVDELRKWLLSPIDQAEVASRMDGLMLRFAFMDAVLGEIATLRFLHSFDQALSTHVSALQQFFDLHAKDMSRSGRLALESGICGYEAQVQWVSRAITAYEVEKGSR